MCLWWELRLLAWSRHGSWRLNFLMEKGWGRGGGDYLFPLDRKFPVEARSLPTNPAPAPSALSTLCPWVGVLRQLADQGVSSRGDLVAVSHLRQRAHIRLNLNLAREAA